MGTRVYSVTPCASRKSSRSQLWPLQCLFDSLRDKAGLSAAWPQAKKSCSSVLKAGEAQAPKPRAAHVPVSRWICGWLLRVRQCQTAWCSAAIIPWLPRSSGLAAMLVIDNWLRRIRLQKALIFLCERRDSESSHTTKRFQCHAALVSKATCLTAELIHLASHTFQSI